MSTRPVPTKTRDALMYAALDEFSRNGIAGTSINSLIRSAGARNSSALHYHFGSKAGLVEELVKFIQDWFDEMREPSLCRLEDAIANGERLDLRVVLEEIIFPYQKLIDSEDWGLSAIRFIAMIEFDEDPADWAAMYKRSSAAAERLRQLVVAATPHLNEDDCRNRLTFYIDSITYGFASYRHLKLSVFGDQEASPRTLAKFYVESGERLFA